MTLPLFAALLVAQVEAHLVGQAFADGRALRIVEYLSDRIGPRSTGTPACARAEAWAVEALKAVGYPDAHREPWTIDATWTAGDVAVSLTAPIERRLVAVSYHNASGTPDGGVEGPLVVLDKLPDKIASAKGAVALATLPGLGARGRPELLAKLGRLNDDLHAAGALALLVAGRDAVPRAVLARAQGGSKLPQLLIGSADALLLARLLPGPLRVRVSSGARLGGPAEAANVVAELRGSSLPDEIVLVHAHLDSVGSSPGATDNAAGVAAVIDAARLLRAQGAKPRRTLRFALMTGEEQGLLGAYAYGERHGEELDRHVVALTMDNGAGRALGLSTLGRADLDAAVAAALAPLRPAGFAEIASGIEDSRLSLSTDALAFFARGVPSLVLKQVEGDYMTHHHRATDTPEKIAAADLAFNVAALATAALRLADFEGPIGKRLSPGEVKALLRSLGLTDQLEELRGKKLLD